MITLLSVVLVVMVVLAVIWLSWAHWENSRNGSEEEWQDDASDQAVVGETEENSPQEVEPCKFDPIPGTSWSLFSSALRLVVAMPHSRPFSTR